ncbi:uncharacterized protein LOC111392022 [Olea europaea var. sylvestris]|uniref:uncharacterized protein LOC111392022 n=1 Tax=Olea europaea var. sylvestris TaxID=158386 RepID=UPI000C1CDAA9|nr:uncharacterized protein LOC111392022 [Olea europaea var. sylvestris]
MIKAITLTNAPENLKLTSPRVQKDIVSAIVSECLHVIFENVRDSFFPILVNESRDISVKEQMLVVIGYVKSGCILEHFISVIHVLNTTAASLKAAINQLFSTHSLSISNLRGQGYDGASNICGTKNSKIETFFTTVHRLVNIVGGSTKRSDLNRENQRKKILESLSVGEISSEQVDVIEMIAIDTISTGKRADILELDDQLDMYILDMHTSEDFEELQGISDLAQKLIVKNKHEVYPLVYKLVTLTLVLPVATAPIERAFSAMTYIKNCLRNRIEDQWLNDSLIVYIEKDVFDKIENDVIMECYQSMRTRR